MIVSFLIASGLMTAVWAMVYSSDNWYWPMLNTICALWPLVPLFLQGGAAEIERLAADKSLLNDNDQDSSDPGKDGRYAFGWFVLGASFMTPFAAPVLLAQLNVIPLHLVWLSAFGSWCLVGAIVLGVAFAIRLTYPLPEHQEEEDDN